MPQNRFRNNMASNAIVDVARRKFLNTSIVSDQQICSVNYLARELASLPRTAVRPSDTCKAEEAAPIMRRAVQWML